MAAPPSSEIQILGRRALGPWLQHIARRPAPVRGDALQSMLWTEADQDVYLQLQQQQRSPLSSSAASPGRHRKGESERPILSANESHHHNKGQATESGSLARPQSKATSKNNGRSAGEAAAPGHLVDVRSVWVSKVPEHSIRDAATQAQLTELLQSSQRAAKMASASHLDPTPASARTLSCSSSSRPSWSEDLGSGAQDIISQGSELTAAPLAAAVSAHFLLVRRGAPVTSASASILWEALCNYDFLDAWGSLGGRGLCDLVYIFESLPDWPTHKAASAYLVNGLIRHLGALMEDLLLWPQSLCIVAAYLARFSGSPRVVADFLRGVLVPFWERYESAVQGSLLPYHILGVSAALACSKKLLDREATEVIRRVVVVWARPRIHTFRARGVAGLALALSRFKSANDALDTGLWAALLKRSAEISKESLAAKDPPPFRPDWLGWLMCGLARGRFRGTETELSEVLAVHVLPQPTIRMQGLMLSNEFQNLSLTVHAAVKLDVSTTSLPGSEEGASVLQLVAPAVRLQCEKGLHSAGTCRSAALLAHAYGVALVTAPRLSEEASEVFSQMLITLFRGAAFGRLGKQEYRVRFQFLSALQCWWMIFGAEATLEELKVAHTLLKVCGEAGATETSEGQEWTSTQNHQEVIKAIPKTNLSGSVMEEFAFPFWIDILLRPKA